MNKKLKLAIAGVAVCCFVLSCKHKTAFETLPVVHYNADIAPIISGNCTFSGCHGDSAYKKFKLIDYDGVMKYCDVKANSPETSKLYNVINTFNEEKLMPKKPYNQLTEKQMQLIYVWIGQGAKNN
jgi:hypothetical protein